MRKIMISIERIASACFLTIDSRALTRSGEKVSSPLNENEEMFMVEFGCPAIFEIWEAEQITGDPRNSAYIRCE